MSGTLVDYLAVHFMGRAEAEGVNVFHSPNLNALINGSPESLKFK
jgi:hypothetical protein